MVPDRTKQLVVRLAAFQIVDAVAGLIPRRLVAAHLDHLGVPNYLRQALPVIKLTTSAGLLAGVKEPRIGAATSAALVAYYAAAARFHLLAGDHPVMAVPAAVCGAIAAMSFVRFNR